MDVELWRANSITPAFVTQVKQDAAYFLGLIESFVDGG
jgi:hypothetical protein